MRRAFAGLAVVAAISSGPLLVAGAQQVGAASTEIAVVVNALAEHVQRLYAEAGGTAKINRVSIGAGTDAAFAALKTKAPVIEGMGLRNFGAHSNNAEYVNISSIEPRLYLLTRLIMDIAAGKAGQGLAR